MFLTADELADLTDRRRRDAQCAALTAMGIPFRVSADGRPKVLRAEVERLLSSKPERASRQRPQLGVVR